MNSYDDFVPAQCWFVSGEDEADELAVWRTARPDFISWDQNWFENKFINTGQLIDSDSDSYGCGGGHLLLFASKAAAELYSERDAAIASGLRKIEDAVFAVVAEPDEDAFHNEESLAKAQEQFSDIFWTGKALAAFHGKRGSYIVFANDDEGRRNLNDAISQLKSIAQI